MRPYATSVHTTISANSQVKLSYFERSGEILREIVYLLK